MTARLSKRFYEKFGDELTNELVDWLNAVDATYRSDLRDLNENNFARLDARLEQRAAEFDARLERRAAGLEAKMDGIEARLDRRIDILEARLGARIDGLEARLDSRIDALEARLDARIDGLEATMDAGFRTVDTKLDARIVDLRGDLTTQMAKFEARMMRWMFTMWTGTMLAMAGLLVAIIRK